MPWIQAAFNVDLAGQIDGISEAEIAVPPERATQLDRFGIKAVGVADRDVRIGDNQSFVNTVVRQIEQEGADVGADLPLIVYIKSTAELRAHPDRAFRVRAIPHHNQAFVDQARPGGRRVSRLDARAGFPHVPSSSFSDDDRGAVSRREISSFEDHGIVDLDVASIDRNALERLPTDDRPPKQYGCPGAVHISLAPGKISLDDERAVTTDGATVESQAFADNQLAGYLKRRQSGC